MSLIYIKNRVSYKSTALILVVAFCLSLLPSPAQAQTSSPGLFSCIFSGVLDCTLFYIKSLIISFIALIGSGINSAMNAPIAGSPVVKESWDIVRGFANMFFILALIIMAFATIFSIAKYEFRTLIARFLIAALLINFSLVIGELLIDWSQSISNVFLTAIGDVGSRLAQGTDLGKHFAPPNNQSVAAINTVDLQGWQQGLEAGLDIVMLSIILFSLLVLLFFSIIRIPILWALLIISPIAWITYILPTTMNINRQWWKNFIAWNIFMPIYLFFIYFGVYFLNNKQKVLSSTSGPLISGFNTAFQDIFFYILIAMFLIGGAKIAMSSSMAAGAGGVAAGIWARGRTTARFAGSRIPFVPYGIPKRFGGGGMGMTSTSDISGAYKEAKQYYGREGILGIGGTRKAEEEASGVAGSVFRVPGMAEKNLSRNVDAETKKLKEKGTHLNRGELERLINTGSPEQKIAAAQLFADENYGALSTDQITGVRQAFGQNLNTSLAASTFRKIKWDEIPADDLRQFLNERTIPNDPNSPLNPNYVQDANVRSLIYNALIDKGRANENEIQTALGLAKSGQQRGNIIKKSRDYLAKSLTGGQRQTLLTGLGAAPENNEARIELLKIMAEESDTFFHDQATGAADNNQLATYSRLFGNVGDRRKFLENVAKKDADSAAMVMLDDAEIRLRDDSGNEITRATHTDAEELALRQTIRKLSVEDKLTQHRGQYASANFQQELARDMAKNSSSLQEYLKNDKYASARTYIGGAGQAEEQARNAIFARQYLQPFQLALGRANNLLRSMGPKAYTSRTALDQDIRQVRDELNDLKKIRGNYEDLYRYNNILSPNGQLDPHTQTQITNFDTAIQILNDRLTRIADAKRTRNP